MTRSHLKKILISTLLLFLLSSCAPAGRKTIDVNSNDPQLAYSVYVPDLQAYISLGQDKSTIEKLLGEPSQIAQSPDAPSLFAYGYRSADPDTSPVEETAESYFFFADDTLVRILINNSSFSLLDGLTNGGSLAHLGNEWIDNPYSLKVPWLLQTDRFYTSDCTSTMDPDKAVFYHHLLSEKGDRANSISLGVHNSNLYKLKDVGMAHSS